MDRDSSVVEVLDGDACSRLYTYMRDVHMPTEPDCMASVWGPLTFWDLQKAWDDVADVAEKLDVPDEFTAPSLCAHFGTGSRYSFGHVLAELMVQLGEWEWVGDPSPTDKPKQGRLRRVEPKEEEPEEEEVVEVVEEFDFDAVVTKWMEAR